MRTQLLIITAFLVSTVTVYPDTIHVPADYATIQAAIDAAVNGDTVLVAPGSYIENIDFHGKAITVRSSDCAEETIIDGGCPSIPGIESVVSFSNGEGVDSVLKGFTLTNGAGTYHEFYPGNWIYGGGGIYCRSSSPIIANNIISGNMSYLGGGIYCYEASPIIMNNTISENAADVGGGINCNICNPTITNNTISGNTAESGGGIFCNFSLTIANNTISGNTADDGGGIYCYYRCSLTIMNNNITGNSTLNPAGHGGGILCEDSDLIIINSILWNNRADYFGPEISLEEPSTLTISYSDVKGGQASVYVEPGGTLNWGSGMIKTDPLFVEPGCWDEHGTPGYPWDDCWVEGDYHLTFESPCRDTGDNTAVTELYDFEGDPRICHGTVDIGADEFYTHLYVTGDRTPGGSIQGKFVGLPGTTPVGLFIGSGILPTPIPTMWGEYWLQAPWFLFTLIPIPSNGILELPTTLPGSIPAPYDIPMQALIGLNADSLSNLCVLEVR